MIRYPLPKPVVTLIDEHDKTWLRRAAQRTAKLRAAGKYNEKDGIWSDVKPVYMRLQRNKCAFCEQKVEGEPLNLAAHDVEHYRPKGRVLVWPPSKARKNPWEDMDLRYDFATGDALTEGYYLLAYHPLNYLASCKACNSTLKSDYFPIAGQRLSRQDDPRRLASEQPFLIYPLGDVDDNPQELIEFDGIRAQPRPRDARSQGWRRARVTIDFFQLNLREDLLQDRAKHLLAFDDALQMTQIAPDPSQRSRAAEYAELLASPAGAHSNCLNSFRRLYERDAAQARRIADATFDFLKSKQR